MKTNSAKQWEIRQLSTNKLLQQFLPVVLQSIVLCCLLIYVVAFLIEHYFHIVSPVDLDYAERWHAYSALQAFASRDHVTSAYTMPYNALPYPPFSYLLHGGLGKLLGADLLGIRTIGRSVAFIATLTSTGFIVLIAKSLKVRLIWGITAGLLFLMSEGAHFFAVSLRPDELACAIMLFGIYAVVALQNYWLVGAVFALAIATKHSFIAVPLVLFVSLLLKRNFRQLFQFSGSCIITGLLIAILSSLTLGPYWWQGPLLQGFHGADIKQLIFFLGEGFKQPVIVVGLAVVSIAALSEPLSTIAASFIVSLTINVAALVKVGAAANYFLEPAAIASILTAYLGGNLLSNQNYRSKTAAWLLLLALVIPSTVYQGIEASHFLKGEKGRSLQSKSLVEVVSKAKGPILTDTSSLYFDTNHQPYVCPPDLIMAAAENGKIDDKPMHNYIKQKTFELIVVQSNWKERRFFPQAWISIISENYQEVEVVDGFQILRPRK